MNIEPLCCPSCGASISMDVKGIKNMFCPYCGTQFAIDDGNMNMTKTINVNKNIKIHKRITNDAAIEHEKTENRKHRRDLYFSIIAAMCIPIVMYLGFYFSTDVIYRKDRKSEALGMIAASISHEDAEKMKYEALVSQFRAAGFTNIEIIDMDESVNKDYVFHVSINGNAYFSSSDYFYPDATIIITHH